MRILLTCVCGSVFMAAMGSSPSDAQTPRKAARADIEDIGWLSGAWKGGSGRVSFEELWIPAAGGAMLAVSRTLEGDRMVAFEFLRIVERDGGLVYIAQPNGGPPTEFVLTKLTKDSVVFENPEHDFPRMVRYTRRSDGTLEARASDGADKAETFLFHPAR
jgi:hypothetical protein